MSLKLSETNRNAQRSVDKSILLVIKTKYKNYAIEVPYNLEGQACSSGRLKWLNTLTKGPEEKKIVGVEHGIKLRHKDKHRNKKEEKEKIQ